MKIKVNTKSAKKNFETSRTKGQRPWIYSNLGVIFSLYIADHICIDYLTILRNYNHTK